MLIKINNELRTAVKRTRILIARTFARLSESRNMMEYNRNGFKSLERVMATSEKALKGSIESESKGRSQN